MIKTSIKKFKKELANLGFQSYQDYLRSEHWQNVKRRYWRSKFKKCCYVCGKKGFLQLHHKTYKRIGKENLWDLILLCSNCHKELHEWYKKPKNKKLGLWKLAKIFKKRKEFKKL